MGCSGSSPGNAAARMRMWMNDRYELGDKLGEGGFAQVREAWLRFPREPRAIKLIYMRDGATANRRQAVDRDKRRLAKREALIWRKIGDHENVVRLFETYSKDLVYYMVMERCRLTLMVALVEMPHSKETDMRRIFREMIRGVAHLHSLRIVHADIKLSNYLLGGCDGNTVKLADFGLAEQMPEGARYLEGQVGTDMYMSPEMVNCEGFNLSTDIWSLGVTVYLLLHGEFPYADNDATGSGMPEPSFRRCDGLPDPSASATSFAQRLLVRGRDLRCTAREALELPLLTRSDSADEAGSEAGDSPSLTRCLARARALTKKVDMAALDTQAQQALDAAVMRHFRPTFSHVSTVSWGMSSPRARSDDDIDEIRSVDTSIVPVGRRSERRTQSESPRRSKTRDRNGTQPAPLKECW